LRGGRFGNRKVVEAVVNADCIFCYPECEGLQLRQWLAH
jgi:hypothetical protein